MNSGHQVGSLGSRNVWRVQVERDRQAHAAMPGRPEPYS